ncbi:hypothetical protein L1987_52467 [Smallanthus sonchifolius]|uniref:Uncharacterized protein n=1 Tax=Smallanthus sonchifolius TaxID=185202 RepID=A0ACB9ESW0_9ASTR|nr:hypothetical protein L1987_52467 [Smallanthus sonchifolius]
MVTTASMGVLVRTMFIVLFCVMTAVNVYLFFFGDYVSCFDVHSRWYMLITADFTTYVVVIGAWVAYKESNWIIAAIIMVSMNFLGSNASIGYILVQFYKLSIEESLKDPLHFVLARRPKKCFTAIGIDIYIHVAIFSAWITYKESSWASAFFWTVLLVLFRGVTICAYILRELFYLSPHEPASLIIVKKTNKDLDPPLMAYPN